MFKRDSGWIEGNEPDVESESGVGVGGWPDGGLGMQMTGEMARYASGGEAEVTG